MTALRRLLATVTACAAPLWCRLRGHGPFGARYGGRRYCISCGNWTLPRS